MTKSAYNRPSDLPDFDSPPLREVVLGVQFQPPVGYTQVHLGEVWNLYKSKFPEIQEHPPLQPTFETFGMSPAKLNSPPFNLVTGAMHDRFWFVQPDGCELIQFQKDRIHHNWRKLSDAENEYPHFNYMIAKFEEELVLFQSYIKTLQEQELIINQCEVAFINQIDVDSFSSIEATKWFKFINSPTLIADDFNFTLREVILDDFKKPLGRLIVELVSAVDRNGKNIFQLALTVRGSVDSSDIKSSLKFLMFGHDLIVRRFTELTTDEAHNMWKRKK